jgi:hypothetical protein
MAALGACFRGCGGGTDAAGVGVFVLLHGHCVGGDQTSTGPASIFSSSGCETGPRLKSRSNTTNGTTVTESYLYTYTGSLITNVTLRRQTNGGAWTTIRQVALTYDANNNLKLAQVEDGASPTPNVLDTSYFRYYSSMGCRAA